MMIMDDASQNRRVLVIDDNHAIHHDFQKVFRSDADAAEATLNQVRAALFGGQQPLQEPQRFELDCADQGQRALALVQTALKEGRPYAVAFVDMRMPTGWDGLVTIERLWKEDPRLQVVICTAYSDQPWDEIRARIGRNDNLLILQKPFSSVEVSQLAGALSRKWNLAHKVDTQLNELNRLVDDRTAELQRANDRLTQLNQSLVMAVTDLDAAQTEISRKNAELEQLASRDSLTGCLNRRAMYVNLETVFAESREQGSELCCVMIDIDHFKRVNDQFGHMVGDYAIQAVAACLGSAVRLADIVGRYGGEEFCLVFPRTTLSEAADMAERLRIRIESEAGARVRTSIRLTLTVSCGVSSTKLGAYTPLELVDQADKALYAAKESGRNCVMTLDTTLAGKDTRDLGDLIEPYVRRITPRSSNQADSR
jgi:diguanylate cyclase (GGDEF)-like protein